MQFKESIEKKQDIAVPMTGRGEQTFKTRVGPLFLLGSTNKTLIDFTNFFKSFRKSMLKLTRVVSSKIFPKSHLP